jgi:hypothetical protein
MPGTLHITNGDSVALHLTGLGGNILSWRDVLHEGPVPSGLTLDELSALRAGFLAGLSGEAEPGVKAGLWSRNQALASFHQCSEVVLWFEHDLFDQLQLIQILEWFSHQEGQGTKLSLICTDQYLGTLKPEQLRELYPARREVTRGELGLASRAWQHFCSPAPTGLAQFLREDTSTLPFLHGALLRHLQQFPSVSNGLSRTESQILAIAGSKVTRICDLFLAGQKKEERIFMGDLTFMAYVRGLTHCRVPLLRLAGSGEGFAGEVAVTSEGGMVLRGEADHVRLNGIDRWLGGVHLRDGDLWRWDEANMNVVRS